MLIIYYGEQVVKSASDRTWGLDVPRCMAQTFYACSRHRENLPQAESALCRDAGQKSPGIGLSNYSQHIPPVLHVRHGEQNKDSSPALQRVLQ